MPKVWLSRRWDFNRPDLLAENCGFQTERGKQLFAACLEHHRLRRQLDLKIEEGTRTLKQMVVCGVSSSQPTLLADLLAKTKPTATPAIPNREQIEQSTDPASSSPIAVTLKPIRNSGRLSAKKREGQEFTLEAQADKCLHDQIIRAVQPTLNFRVAHLPIYVSTTNWPERLSPKVCLSELYGDHMGAHALADIDLLVNRQRIDIVAFRPNQKAVVPESNSTPVAVERTVRDPEAPRKFELLMEARGKKRRPSEAESFNDIPESLPEPSLSPAAESSTDSPDLPRRKYRRSNASRRLLGDSGSIPLYAFILSLLAAGREDLVKWTGNAVGEFRIMSSARVAELWGNYRQNSGMNYDKMARAMRYYYEGKNPIMASVTGRSLTYRFTHTSDLRIQGHRWTDLQMPGAVKFITIPVRPASKAPSESSYSSGSDSNF